MNLPAIIFSIVFVAIAVTNIVMWRLDEHCKERIRGWRLTFYIDDWFFQRVLKQRQRCPIGIIEKWDAEEKIWRFEIAFYAIRKLDNGWYECGCFTGSYDEMVMRNTRTYKGAPGGRPQILQDYYTRQLAKALRQ